MSAIAPTKPLAIPTIPVSSVAPLPIPIVLRMVFRGVDWHTYQTLSESTAEGQHVRLAYDGKDLEIMVTSNDHEHYKELLNRIISAICTWLDIDYVSCGQTTWKTQLRGIEADLSYYFDPEKIRVAREALARRSLNPADYPRPDMAIEIDVSYPQVDRPTIYKDLGVVEVWRHARGQNLVIEQLQADGSYSPVQVGRFLRIQPDDVLRWLNEAATETEPAWNRRLNQWAMGLGRQA
jgi:Uma2 family endonuclease